MRKRLKESTRRNCGFQCIGACVKKEGGGGGNHGYFLEQHIAYQVY